MLSSASDKAKLFVENFSKNSNLDDSGISLPVLPSKTNLKLHNISVTPKMVKKVIMNLDLSKASGPDCIPVVVLKNCEPELSYILAELYTLMTFLMVFICDTAIHADDNTLYSKCGQASDLWQQLELASELESDLRDTVDRKWFVDFNVGKTQLVSFDRSDNTSGIDVKMDGPVLEEKSSFKMLGF